MSARMLSIFVDPGGHGVVLLNNTDVADSLAGLEISIQPGTEAPVRVVLHVLPEQLAIVADAIDAIDTEVHAT